MSTAPSSTQYACKDCSIGSGITGSVRLGTRANVTLPRHLSPFAQTARTHRWTSLLRSSSCSSEVSESVKTHAVQSALELRSRADVIFLKSNRYSCHSIYLRIQHVPLPPSRPETAVKTYKYSADGRFFASVTVAGYVDASFCFCAFFVNVARLLLHGAAACGMAPLGLRQSVKTSSAEESFVSMVMRVTRGSDAGEIAGSVASRFQQIEDEDCREQAQTTCRKTTDAFSIASVQILDAETAALVSEIPLKTVIDICFSPKGTQLSTWERHGKTDSGNNCQTKC